MATAGRDPLDYDGFSHRVFEGYVGSTRSRSALWLTGSEGLTVDGPGDTPVTVAFSDDEKVYDSLFFYDHLNEYDWYPLFLDGNHPLTVVENRALADGPTLVMVKDSFGNTLAPLLVSGYRRIVLVDPRYYRGSVADLCGEYGADEVLFCYSLERICTDLNLSILK